MGVQRLYGISELKGTFKMLAIPTYCLFSNLDMIANKIKNIL